MYNGFPVVWLAVCAMAEYKMFYAPTGPTPKINAVAKDFSESGRPVELRWVHIDIADLLPDIVGPTNRGGNSVGLNKP